jgi:hypothetical protein
MKRSTARRMICALSSNAGPLVHAKGRLGREIPAHRISRVICLDHIRVYRPAILL